jgi:hypothetical protein
VDCGGRRRPGAIGRNGAERNGNQGLDSVERLAGNRDLDGDIGREQGRAEGCAERAVLPSLVIRGRGLRDCSARIGVAGVRAVAGATVVAGWRVAVRVIGVRCIGTVIDGSRGRCTARRFESAEELSGRAAMADHHRSAGADWRGHETVRYQGATQQTEHDEARDAAKTS